jgi:multiple antibiotic resistance protein
MFDEFASAFFKLMVIMDAFGLIPMFLILCEKMPRKQRKKAADRTMIVATVLMIFFIFAGLEVLNYFGISLGSFQIAGGIILLILGLKIVMGMRLTVQEKNIDRFEFTSVPMATPLIIGPGTITTVIILVAESGYSIVLAAGLLNLLLMWVVFRNANKIYDVIGHQGTQVISRLVGIVFTAFAVEFIKDGVMALIAG